MPYVEQRDILSQNSLKRTAELQSLVNRIRHVEVDAIKISRENRVLAAEVLRLAEQANPSHANMQLEPGTQKELQRLEKEVKSSRQKWKVIKGTASAVVAGSGVDWTRDEQLTDMVLDKD